jgi:hypothetical protein
MATTYEAIATNTLGSTSTGITFSSINGTYTDLVLICNILMTTTGKSTLIQFNSDTGTNYSYTRLTGDGSSASSARASSIAYSSIGYTGVTTSPMVSITNIQNYSNTTTNKSFLTRFGDAGTQTQANTSLWRSTSAITSMFIYPDSSTFAAGSTFTLYGIKAA